MTAVAFFNQSLKKNQLESKLDFAFVSFPYKLNFLDFCYYYFFFKLKSLFFILFLFRYFVCKDIECNKL